MRRYAYKKLYIWNPKLSYLAGLVASDGNLSNNGRHINITSKDIEMLETVKKILGLRSKIGIKANGFGGTGYYLQFGDVALYDFLFQAGITPAKSKTIIKVDVPSEFYGDFLRGLFDGDGTVYGFWDPRWRNSLMYYTGFVSASPSFLKWLSETNTAIIGTSPGKIKPNNRAQTLTYAKKDSQKLFNAMYSDFRAPCLTRKRTKFIDFLKLDPYPDRESFGRVL